MISLKEALVRKNRGTDVDPIIKEEILSFLSSTYSTFKDNQYSIYKNKDKWIVDVDGSIKVVDDNIYHLTNDLFEFGVVNGDFDCRDCENLNSLKGAPEQREKFVCSHCPKSTNLKGISKKINYGIWCGGCENLKSIDDISSDFKGALYITSVDDFDLSKFKGKVNIYSKTKIIQRDGKILIPKMIKNRAVRGWKELRKNTAPTFVK